MKQIEIVFAHERLNKVNEILYKHKVGGLSFYDIKGRGRVEHKPVQERTAEGYQTGRSYVPEFGIRTKLEVLGSRFVGKTDNTGPSRKFKHRITCRW